VVYGIVLPTLSFWLLHNETFSVRGSHISLFDTSSGSGMGSGSLAGVASSCDENWVPTEFDGDKTR